MLKPLKLLRSRFLFKNWFWAGLRYFLWRYGITKNGIIKVVCRDGGVVEVPAHTYRSIVNNYLSGVIKDVSCRGYFVVLQDNSRLSLEALWSSVWKDALRLGWVYDGVNKYWFKGIVRFKHMHLPVLEVFEYGDHEGLDVKGKVVIDVGAYVGDSAIYFVLRGASRVIAIEPHPGAYQEMLENIRLNNMEGKIIPVNAGLASKPGCIETSGDVDSTGVMYHKLGNKHSNCVGAITLNEVIHEFSIDPSNAVLKMDCEGCEYDVILNDYSHVRLFNEVYFEYHPYQVGIPVSRLLSLLKEDYTCNSANTESFYTRHSTDKEQLGIIHCKRKA